MGRWDTEMRAKKPGRAGEPPTVEAVRLEGPTLGEHGQQRLFPKDQLSDYTITSPEAASAPRALSQFKATQDNWVPVQAKGTAQMSTDSSPRSPAYHCNCSAHRLSRISGSVMRVLVM